MTQKQQSPETTPPARGSFGPATRGSRSDECKLINHELTAHNMKMMVPEQKDIFGGTHVASDFNVLKDSLKDQVEAIHAETVAKLPSMGELTLPSTSEKGKEPAGEKEAADDDDDDDDEEVEVVSVEEMRRKARGV